MISSLYLGQVGKTQRDTNPQIWRIRKVTLNFMPIDVCQN